MPRHSVNISAVTGLTLLSLPYAQIAYKPLHLCSSLLPCCAVQAVLSYDGTAYCGFQKQPNGDTVQERVRSLMRVLGTLHLLLLLRIGGRGPVLTANVNVAQPHSLSDCLRRASTA